MCIPAWAIEGAMKDEYSLPEDDVNDETERKWVYHVNSQLTSPRQPVESDDKMHHITIQLHQE